MERALHTEALAEIRNDIAALEKQLAELRAVERYHAGKVGDGADSNGRVALPVKVAPGGNYSKLKMKDAAYTVLSKAGKPLSTREVTDALRVGGYESRNPEGLRNSVFSMMRREASLFKNIGKGMWELRDNGLPQPATNQ